RVRRCLLLVTSPSAAALPGLASRSRRTRSPDVPPFCTRRAETDPCGGLRGADAPPVSLFLCLLGLPLLLQCLLSRFLLHALLRVLVLGRHPLASLLGALRLSAVAQAVHHLLAAPVSLHARRG